MLYCTNCGTSIKGEEGRFCGNCGIEVQPQLNNYTPSNDNNSTSENVKGDYANNEQHLLELFVGNEKKTFYLNNWAKGSKNWAAFFFTIFWLGYRKMYIHVLIILLIYLIYDSILFFLEIDSFFISNFIALIVAFFYGYSGNNLYREHALKTINKLQLQISDDNLLRKNVIAKGGVSKQGIFIAIALFVIYVFIATILFTLPDTTISEVEFGRDERDAEILNHTDTFEPLEEIFYSFYFSDYKGGEYTIVLEKDYGEYVKVYDSKEMEVPPDWDGVTNSISAPPEEGTYIFKIVKNEEISAEGTFFVIE